MQEKYSTPDLRLVEVMIYEPEVETVCYALEFYLEEINHQAQMTSGDIREKAIETCAKIDQDLADINSGRRTFQIDPQQDVIRPALNLLRKQLSKILEDPDIRSGLSSENELTYQRHATAARVMLERPQMIFE